VAAGSKETLVQHTAVQPGEAGSPVGPGSGPPGSVTRRRRNQSLVRALGPLPWLLPALALIVGVVLWPVYEMVRTSFLRIGSSGYVRGSAGFGKYTELFGEPAFRGVLWHTLIWVVGVVAVTMLGSLALSQLMNRQFRGRSLVRWALIVPWAASVVMSSIIFKWILDWSHGVLNTLLLDLHLISRPVDYLGQPSSAFVWMMAVAVFVSLPFTTYVLLSGHATIPAELYEAAQVDGASRWQVYRRITLPLLRPAMLVGSVINIINVFNSFPIIYTMFTGAGYGTDTTTTFMYKLKQTDIGESAAMAVVNFVLILLLVALYLRVIRWNRTEESR
jgi:ABC-type sugar transport system permease subunit